MTNHWTDIDNTSCVFVFGANPAENHPASMAHINAARFGDGFGSKNAKLIVVDPRLTRTARQCDPARGDMYVRIRPGTNVAFANGLLKWVFDNIGTYDATAAANMLAWHNGTAPNSLHVGRTFVDDAGTTQTLTAAALAGAKYDGVATSALANGWPKYCDTRFKVTSAGDDYQHGVLTATAWTTGQAWQFTGFPIVAADVSDPDCVYQQLQAHLAPYDTATVAGICGCTEADIVNVARALIDHSRFKSSDFGAAVATPKDPGYRATTILYAMGQTQHTDGSQGIKDLAVLQTLMGNMGRPGGGINALRGIHNVQGSTDFGLLFDSIPGYSANPAVGETYTHYQNGMFGNRVESTGGSIAKDPAVPGNLGLQQRGFHNMTNEWFGNGSSSGADVASLYGCGRRATASSTSRRSATWRSPWTIRTGSSRRSCWGQNPAVTEPNQSKVRTGLKALDLLVVVDMYETETAAVDRKGDGVTYLIPACSHAEEAGSVTNSGRWLQWRERATSPKGNSKADLELLLRFAYALDEKLAFSHIRGVWGGLGTPIVPSVANRAYNELFGKYGWKPTDATAFEDLTVTTEMWAPGASAPADRPVKGSEVVAEKIHIEICRPLADTATSGGTMWIYSGAGNAAGYYATLGLDVQPAAGGNTWLTKARAKSRNNTYTGTAGTTGANNYPRWGWAWLLNRRVFYNNSEVAGDVADVFVAPGVVCGLFTIKSTGAQLADWSLLYRKYKTFADAPSVATGPHYISAGKTLMGRFPGHTEPYESPREDVVALYGHNMAGTGRLIVEGTDGTAIGAVADYPLVLTSIRCVEHFQGGPITRNNSWNVEAEPVPWVEINSVDARKYNIADGDWVNVITARSNSGSEQEGRSPNSGSGWARGFKARVGVGLQSNQRVAAGVVAIPWHWGDKGLGTGSRANDLCIDAWDANTTIPEYKACLCKIQKM